MRECSLRIAFALWILFSGHLAWGVDPSASFVRCVDEGVKAATARRPADVRQDYIARNGFLKFTTTEQNRRAIDVMARSGPNTKTWTFIVTNQWLKMTNKIWGMDFGTATTNRYFDLMIPQLNELKAKFPGLLQLQH